MTRRRTLLFLTSALVLVLQLVGSPTSTPPAMADTVSDIAGDATALVAAPGTVAQKELLRVDAPPTAPQDCTSVLSQLAELAAAGVSKTTCVDTDAPPPDSGGTMSPYPNPEQQCAFDGVLNTWYYSREWFCYIAFQQLINTINVDTGEIIGQAWYTINHAAGFDPRNPVWENFVAFYLDNWWGDAANQVASASSCSGCTGDSYDDVIPPYRTAPPDVAITGRNLLNDHPGAGGIHNISVRWVDSFMCTGCVNAASVSYVFPLNVRCDGQANTGAAEGCAIPSFVPQLALTGYSSGNTATAFVSYIQRNVDNWGQYPSGRLLTRLNNPSQASVNRAAMCAGFTPLPLVTNDSCDEYPFASSYQSGNMLGQTASQCSQVVPQYAAGTWTYATYPGYSTSQRCGIGHTRLSDNQSVGGMYSAFIQNNRVIDGDPFWVGIFN
jgi:hypothetical protein